jgi:hypothetical protein
MSMTMFDLDRRLVRHTLFGVAAVYAVLEDDGEIVTAEVVEAPGLEPGMRIRLLSSAVRAMEQLDWTPAPEIEARRALAPAAR